MGQKDIAEKTLESYNDVFADIVNVLLFDGRTIIRPEELEDQSPRAVYKADGKLREIERDVAKRWLKGNIRIACLGFENQTAVDRDIALRIMGYDGAEYRWQLTQDAKIARYPVVSLVLYFGDKHWDGPLTLYEAAHVPDLFKPFISDMKVNLFEIAHLTPETVGKFKSDFRFVADYFVQNRMTGEYHPDRSDVITHVQETLHMLSVMTGDHRFEDVINDDPQKEAATNMCEVLDRIERKGWIEGERKGRAEGERKGRAEGERKGRAEGERKGRAEGERKGRAEGETKLAALMLKLMEAGRSDDAFRAASDPICRQKLYRELGID